MALFGLPILCEILFVNLLTPNEKSISYQQIELPKSYNSIKTHQDFYNSTMLYKMELFRIKF
jgi:hypothetical protein